MVLLSELICSQSFTVPNRCIDSVLHKILHDIELQFLRFSQSQIQEQSAVPFPVHLVDTVLKKVQASPIAKKNQKEWISPSENH